MIEDKDLFCSLYADRGSHYWHTPKAGGKVDKDNPTQVGRALAQLGIELIAAYSPQARGRSERMFGTLQKRLPQELRLNGITTMAAANRFLQDVFLPAHNARFDAAKNLWTCGKPLTRLPTGPTRQQQNRSRQLACYINRSIQMVLDTNCLLRL